MNETPKKRRLSASGKRILIYLMLFGLFLTWNAWHRHWSPNFTFETQHYHILSSATEEQTKKIGEATEVLFMAYTNFFSGLLANSTNQPKLQIKLFKDRDEFRRCHYFLGWAEAFYQKPYCNAFYSTDEINPRHWMLHEATHQLNAEIAGFHLVKWLEEGLATYFSTSLVRRQRVMLGEIDPNTYPVWWMDELATSGDLASDIKNGSVIPLDAIITGKGGPSMKKQFNLYYLHWWSLTHFLFHYDNGKYRAQALLLVKDGGDLKSFEQRIGPTERVQTEWYGYVRGLKHFFGNNPPENSGKPM